MKEASPAALKARVYTGHTGGREVLEVNKGRDIKTRTTLLVYEIRTRLGMIIFKGDLPGDLMRWMSPVNGFKDTGT